MHSHHTSRARTPSCDLARVALAVDALTVGIEWPTLVHVDRGPDPFDRAAIVEIGLTPLTGATSLPDVMTTLAGWCAPPTWYAVGVSAPASLRSTRAHGLDVRCRPARVVHVIGRGGERSTRLSVPDEPRLSGPTDGLPADSPLDRCLRRVLGLGR